MMSGGGGKGEKERCIHGSDGREPCGSAKSERLDILIIRHKENAIAEISEQIHRPPAILYRIL